MYKQFYYVLVSIKSSQIIQSIKKYCMYKGTTFYYYYYYYYIYFSNQLLQLSSPFYQISLSPVEFQPKNFPYQAIFYIAKSICNPNPKFKYLPNTKKNGINAEYSTLVLLHALYISHN